MRPSLRRALVLGVLAGTALLVAAVALLHTPPARARVLRWLAQQLERDYGIELNARELRYNLTTLAVHVEGLTVSAAGHAGRPFLQADRVDLDLPLSVLWDGLAVESLTVVRPRLLVWSGPDGASNLPSPPTETEDESAPLNDLPIGYLSLQDLEVRWEDEPGGTSLEVPELDLEMAPREGSGIEGPLRLGRPARFRSGSAATTIGRLEGRLAWDSGALAITNLTAEFSEGSLGLEATLRNALSDPRIQAGYRGRLRLNELGSWMPLETRLAGELEISGTIDGPADEPRLTLRASGSGLEYGRLTGVALSTVLRATPATAAVESLLVEAAGGRIRAEGSVAYGETTSGRMGLQLEGLEAAGLSALLPDPPPVDLATTLSGRAEVEWTGPTPRDADLTAALQLRPAAGALPVSGTVKLASERGEWTLGMDGLRIGSLHLSGTAGGVASADSVAGSSLAGSLTAHADDLQELTRSLGDAAPGGLGPLRGALDADLRLSGTLGAPQASGRMALTSLEYEDIGPGELRAGFRASAELVEVVDLNITAGANVLDASGRLRPASEAIEGRFEAVLDDLSQLAGAVPARWRPGGAALVSGTLGGGLDRPVAELSIRGRDIRAAGQTFDQVTAEVGLEDTLVSLAPLRLQQTAGALTAEGRFDLESESYRLDLSASEFSLHPLPGGEDADPIPLTAILTGAFQGSGSLQSLAGTGRFQFDNLQYEDVRLDAVTADLRLEGRTAHLSAAAPDLATTATASLTISDPARFEAAAVLQDADIRTLLSHLAPGATVPLTGSLSARLEAGGTLDDPAAATAELTVVRLTAESDGLPIATPRPATVRYAGGELERADLELRLGSSRLDLKGSTGAGRTLSARLDGELADVSPLLESLRRAGLIDIPDVALAGRLEAAATLAGPLEQPALDGTVTLTEALVQVQDLPAVQDLGLTGRFDAGVLQIEAASARWQGAVVTAGGELPARLFEASLPERYVRTLPAAGPARFGMRVTSITPELLRPFVDADVLSQLDGRIDARVDVTLDEPRLDAAEGLLVLERAGVTLAGVPLDQQDETTIALDAGRLEIRRWNWQGANNHVTVAGSVDLADPAAPVFDLATSADVDLRLLGAFLPEVATGGRAALDASIEGTPAEPRVDGAIEIADLDLRLSEPRLVATDLHGRIVLRRDEATIERLAGTVNGGDLTIGGTVRYPEFELADGIVTVTATGVALELPEGLRSEADATLRFILQDPTPLLQGDVTIVRGAYREPMSIAEQVLGALEESGIVPPGEAGSALRLDLRLVTRNDIVVDNNYGQLSLGADLRIVGTLEQPALLGRAAVREGGVIFLGGNVYRVDQGAIDFTNPNAIEPELNIRARTQVSEYDITLTVTGTPDALETELASDPPLGQSDLVSLLVTGRTLEEAGSAGAEVARDQVLSYLSGEFVGVAGERLGLDVLRIERGTGADDVRFDPGLVASETDPSARLTFGKNIGRDLELVYSQSLRRSGDFTWIVSYRLPRNIELRGVSRDNRDRSYEFRHDVSFGGGDGAAFDGRAQSPEPAEQPDAVEVGEVRFLGEPGYGEAELLDELSLTAGDDFDFYAWQRDRDRLLEFYVGQGFREARITTHRVPTADPERVTVEYAIQRGPLTRLSVEGWEAPRSTVAAMEEAWTRSVFDEFLRQDLQSIARAAAVRRGHLQAEAEVTIGLDERRNEKLAVVRVEPGPRFDELRIAFEGQAALDESALEEALLGAGSVEDALIDPDGAEAAIEAAYRREGYLDATAEVQAPLFEGSTAVVPVRVAEGPRYRIAAIELHGIEARPADEVRELLNLQVGDTFRPVEASLASQRIDAGYRALGFNDVTVRTSTVRREPDGIELVYAVDEGRQQILRDISVVGAGATRTSVVERALQLELGEPANLAEWYQARKRLYDTNAFRRVDLQLEPLDGSAESGGIQPVRARVLLEEWPRFRLRYGIQLNDEEKPESVTDERAFTPGLVADLTHRNLLGRAASVGVSARLQREEKTGRAFLTLPSLFGLPVSSNLFVARSRADFGGGTSSPRTTDRSAFTAEQRFRLGSSMRVSYSYNFERNHTFRRDVDPDDPFAFDLTVKIARFNTTTILDTRDDLLDATRGWFHSSSFEYATDWLGSDLRFGKYFAQQTYFRPLLADRIVLASALRLGMADAFGQELIPSERFFAGGGNSVRGYPEDGLGERDFFGDPRGGDALLILNQEVRFPIYRILRGVGFVDAGNVFTGIGDLSLFDLSASVGFGFRVETPLVLIRIDYGKPVNAPAGMGGEGRWFFSVGQLF